MGVKQAVAAFALAAGLMLAPPAWTVAPKDPQAMQTDFSHVTSRAKAASLAKHGALVKIRYVPERFGGEDIRENTGYVPPGALNSLEDVYDRISKLVEHKHITGLVVDIDYRGKSVVPSRIVYIGKGGQTGLDTIKFDVEIW